MKISTEHDRSAACHTYWVSILGVHCLVCRSQVIQILSYLASGSTGSPINDEVSNPHIKEVDPPPQSWLDQSAAFTQ
jgi:hypothetical protein